VAGIHRKCFTSRTKLKRVGFIRIKAPQGNASPSPNLIKHAPKGFTWHKKWLPFLPMIPASSLLQINEKKITIGFSKTHITQFKAPYNYT
jgi:hypothetical protein